MVAGGLDASDLGSPAIGCGSTAITESSAGGVAGGDDSRIVGDCWNEPDGLARDFRPVGTGPGLTNSSLPPLLLLLPLGCRADIEGAFCATTDSRASRR